MSALIAGVLNLKVTDDAGHDKEDRTIEKLWSLEELLKQRIFDRWLLPLRVESSEKHMNCATDQSVASQREDTNKK